MWPFGSRYPNSSPAQTALSLPRVLLPQPTSVCSALSYSSRPHSDPASSRKPSVSSPAHMILSEGFWPTGRSLVTSHLYPPSHWGQTLFGPSCLLVQGLVPTSWSWPGRLRAAMGHRGENQRISLGQNDTKSGRRLLKGPTLGPFLKVTFPDLKVDKA